MTSLFEQIKLLLKQLGSALCSMKVSLTCSLTGSDGDYENVTEPLG